MFSGRDANITYLPKNLPVFLEIGLMLLLMEADPEYMQNLSLENPPRNLRMQIREPV